MQSHDVSCPPSSLNPNITDRYYSCVCGHGFCYVCGQAGNHGCPADDNNNDIDFDHEHGHIAQPVWQRYVFNDEGDPVCTHAAFVRVPWGGHCGGACGDFLPNFLNQCRNCGLRVCNYCRGARAFNPREQTVLAGGDAVEEGDEVEAIEQD